MAIRIDVILDCTDNPMSTIFINPYRFGGNWWEAGGASGALVVYQPKGAASLAASYADLSGNGNDAAPGVAPTFSGATGWAFNGWSQYLIVPNVAPNSTARTAIVQYTDAATDADKILFGFYHNTGGENLLYITLNHSTSAGGVGFHNGIANVGGQSPTQLLGNLAIAGKSGYRNGAFSDTIPAGVPVSSAISIYIGALNFDDATAASFLTCKIQAFALYNNTLTAPQVAAVAAAMAAL